MAQPIVALSKTVRRAVGIDEGLGEFSTRKIYAILSRLGEDPTATGCWQTPARVEKSMAFLTRATTGPNRFCAAPCSTWTTTRW